MTDWRGVAQRRYPDSIDQLDAYVELLRTLGVERGLIGPREVDRLWERHILNCAAVSDAEAGFIPEGVTVVDVGSGAGLPGLVWAIVRPDLQVTLVESMQRRVDFLNLAVDQLDLGGQVSVVRARAEDVVGTTSGQVVTARAVAPMGRLIGWLSPLAVE
ncbi:MAG: 16S rRNA (guanine(527)-N(7))-methyltransferase RsmG, partial [Candidatus Nanopelagicales bacterium]